MPATLCPRCEMPVHAQELIDNGICEECERAEELEAQEFASYCSGSYHFAPEDFPLN